MVYNKLVTIFIVALLVATICLINFSGNVLANEETNLIDKWNHTNGGVCSEKDGVIMLSGDENCPGPYLTREFNPTSDFEVSMDLKAETLGEINRDPMGAGEGFNFGFCKDYSKSQPGVYFEIRARAGGQFLMVWHDDLCDQNGWACNWIPFVYNGLGYNSGYDYWHTPGVDRTNSTVKPDTWYTMKMKVQKEPFVVVGEVYTEQGDLLGSFTVDAINDMAFDDIHYFAISSGHGGTFYVRNIQERTLNNTPSPKPLPSQSTVVSQDLFFLESNSTVTAFAFNSTSYELSFYVSGESGTTGYVQLTIAKTLLPEAQNLKIQLDGKQLNYTLSQSDDTWTLNFSYHHSTHHVNIVLPKTATAENPVSSLTQNEWIIAAAIASLIILLSGLLLFALKKR